MAFVGALADFMVRNLDTMIGCASIPMLHNGVVSGMWPRTSGTNCAKRIWPPSNTTFGLACLCRWSGDSSIATEPRIDQRVPASGRSCAGGSCLGPDFNTADLPALVCAWAIYIPVSQALLGA